MIKRAFRLLSLAAFVAAAVTGFAQEGHPLSGTWAGDWGPTANQRTHLTIVMNWDGKNVTGIINPGDNSIQIGSVFLDVTNWTVRIEADAKDQTGKTTHIAAEGKLDDIGSYHRKLSGSWAQGATKGDFKLVRD
jgi:hypothetical protein